MKNGLYSMKFATMFGHGAGIVVKEGDSLLGGDSAYAWIGTIANDATNVRASAFVSRHDPSMSSIFGPLDRFNVSLGGTIDGDHGRLTGTSPEAPGVVLTVDLALLRAA